MPPLRPRSRPRTFRRTCACLAHVLHRLGGAVFYALFAVPPPEQLWTYFLPADIVPPGPVAYRAFLDLLRNSDDSFRWN